MDVDAPRCIGMYNIYDGMEGKRRSRRRRVYVVEVLPMEEKIEERVAGDPRGFIYPPPGRIHLDGAFTVHGFIYSVAQSLQILLRCGAFTADPLRIIHLGYEAFTSNLSRTSHLRGGKQVYWNGSDSLEANLEWDCLTRRIR